MLKVLNLIRKYLNKFILSSKTSPPINNQIFGYDIKADNDIIDCSKKVVEEQCYEFLNLHETTFAANAWADLSKEAMAFSPDSLAKAILSNDVIKYISKSIRGEHEFRANQEVLTDKVYWLLEQGLNDAITGWNEAKAIEFQKYIKSQKRASRKTKRSVKKEVSVDSLLQSQALQLESNESTTPIDAKLGTAA